MSAVVEATAERLPPFDQLLWRRSRSLTMVDLVARANEAALAVQQPPQQLTFWTVLAKDTASLTERLRVQAGALVLGSRRLGKVGLLLIEVPGQGPFVLSVWPTGSDGAVHLVCTVPASDGRWRRIERWTSRVPSAAKVFLTDSDFLAVGDALAEFGDVAVSKLTARSDDGSSLNRGYPMKKQPTLAQAVGMVDRSSQVRTALLHVGDVVAIHLRRLAGATFYSGDFGAFSDCVLARLERAAVRQRKLYSGRVRRVHRVAPEPIAVKLPDRFFQSPERTGELVSALGSVSHLAVAVVHRNPYLHLAVSDYFDGSTFDLFVTSDDEVDLHPGFASSVESFSRLVQHISDAVPATDVLEKHRAPVATLEELVAAGG